MMIQMTLETPLRQIDFEALQTDFEALQTDFEVLQMDFEVLQMDFLSKQIHFFQNCRTSTHVPAARPLWLRGTLIKPSAFTSV